MTFQCDRIQPCSACSLHQIADICHYDLSESERQPILQAEALKEKDKTILALKEEIVALRGGNPKNELDDRNGPAQKLRLPPRAPRKTSHDNDQTRRYEQDQDSTSLAENGLVHMADDVSDQSLMLFGLFMLPSSIIYHLVELQMIRAVRFTMSLTSSHTKPQTLSRFQHCGTPTTISRA